jgi:hypothetical protein
MVRTRATDVVGGKAVIYQNTTTPYGRQEGNSRRTSANSMCAGSSKRG